MWRILLIFALHGKPRFSKRVRHSWFRLRGMHVWFFPSPFILLVESLSSGRSF